MHAPLSFLTELLVGQAAQTTTTTTATTVPITTTTTASASWFDSITHTLGDKALAFGLMVLGAIAVWVVGRWAIGLIGRLARRAMGRRSFDATLERYLSTSLRVILNVLLLVAVLSVFGVDTTSFAALFAAAGVAIGLAWSGLLANFAAGIFMIFLRPIRVGDFVTAAGVTGTVREIGLFVTVIDAPDNVKTIVGNNKIFGETMQNYTANPFRRVELAAQLDHSVDVQRAMTLLRARLAQIPNVMPEPAPVVEVLTFTLAGPVLCVRPFCHNDHYWDVYFATNAAIVEVCGAAGFPAPEQHFRVATKAA